MAAKHHLYEQVGGGVDHTGWYKVILRRDDGVEVKVTRTRAADLRRAGRIVDNLSKRLELSE